MFGDPPVFPKAADHPNVKTDGFSSGPRFVANCDQDGTVPGGYPPDHNLNGETECVCNPNSHTGEWPDCTGFPLGWTPKVRAMAAKCLAQGWALDTSGGGKCEVPLTSGGNDFDGCNFSAGSPLCADVFGEDFALPEKEVPELVLNLVNGFVAKSGENLGATLQAAASVYAEAVWARYNGEADYADGPVDNHNGSSDDDKTSIALLISGPVFTAHGIPFEWQPDLFRIPPAIRLAYSHIPVAVPYVFNCGANALPSAINTDGATACACASGYEKNEAGDFCVCADGYAEQEDDGSCACPSGTHGLVGSYCVPLSENFAGVSDVSLCAGFGGRAEAEGEGRVCAGLDASGTFCILDSADAFPCRGLFKRARRCNLDYNRPLLNPFTCGAVCPSGSARGRGCE